MSWERSEGVRLQQTLRSTTFTSFNFADHGLGKDGERVLAETLSLDTTLTPFDLEVNDLQRIGGWALVETLRQYSTFTWMNLGYTA